MSQIISKDELEQGRIENQRRKLMLAKERMEYEAMQKQSRPAKKSKLKEPEADFSGISMDDPLVQRWKNGELTTEQFNELKARKDKTMSEYDKAKFRRGYRPKINSLTNQL